MASQAQVTGGNEGDFERRMNEVAERIKAAQANGDMGEVMRLSDSLGKAVGAPSAAAAGKATSDMQAAAGKCGAEPARPPPPSPPTYPDLNLDRCAKPGSAWAWSIAMPGWPSGWTARAECSSR
ncbi:hypothetical protein BH24GEM1_BH24GEM1_19400 [soil metagenome]